MIGERKAARNIYSFASATYVDYSKRSLMAQAKVVYTMSVYVLHAIT
jgi:hypothetical protein